MKKKWITKIALCGMSLVLLAGCSSSTSTNNNDGDNTQQTDGGGGSGSGGDPINPITPAIDGIEDIKVTQVTEYSTATKEQIRSLMTSFSSVSNEVYNEAIALLLEAKVGPEQIEKVYLAFNNVIGNDKVTSEELIDFYYDLLAVFKSLDVVSLYNAIQKRIPTSKVQTLSEYISSKRYDGDKQVNSNALLVKKYIADTGFQNAVDALVNNDRLVYTASQIKEYEDYKKSYSGQTIDYSSVVGDFITNVVAKKKNTFISFFKLLVDTIGVDYYNLYSNLLNRNLGLSTNESVSFYINGYYADGRHPTSTNEVLSILFDGMTGEKIAKIIEGTFMDSKTAQVVLDTFEFLSKVGAANEEFGEKIKAISSQHLAAVGNLLKAFGTDSIASILKERENILTSEIVRFGSKALDVISKLSGSDKSLLNELGAIFGIDTVYTINRIANLYSNMTEANKKQTNEDVQKILEDVGSKISRMFSHSASSSSSSDDTQQNTGPLKVSFNARSIAVGDDVGFDIISQYVVSEDYEEYEGKGSDYYFSSYESVKERYPDFELLELAANTSKEGYSEFKLTYTLKGNQYTISKPVRIYSSIGASSYIQNYLYFRIEGDTYSSTNSIDPLSYPIILQKDNDRIYINYDDGVELDNSTGWHLYKSYYNGNTTYTPYFVVNSSNIDAVYKKTISYYTGGVVYVDEQGNYNSLSSPSYYAQIEYDLGAFKCAYQKTFYYNTNYVSDLTKGVHSFKDEEGNDGYYYVVGRSDFGSIYNVSCSFNFDIEDNFSSPTYTFNDATVTRRFSYYSNNVSYYADLKTTENITVKNFARDGNYLTFTYNKSNYSVYYVPNAYSQPTQSEPSSGGESQSGQQGGETPSPDYNDYEEEEEYDPYLEQDDWN